IDELLAYWIDISKRPTLTVEDFRLFFDRADATVAHFSESYPLMRNKFFERLQVMKLLRDGLPEDATEKNRLTNNAYASMKDVAKKFIHRIKSYFAAEIVASIDRKTMEASTSPNLSQLVNFDKPMTTPAAFDRCPDARSGWRTGEILNLRS